MSKSDHNHRYRRIPAAFCLAITGLLLLGACSKKPLVVNEEILPDPPADRRAANELSVQRLWSASVPSADSLIFGFEPAITLDRACVAGRSGDVTCLNPVSGERLWQRNLDVKLTTGAGIGAGMVFVGTETGDVIALDDGNGALVWRSNVGGELLSPPQASSGVVVVRTAEGQLIGLSTASGNRLWSHDQKVPPLTLRGTGTPKIIGSGSQAGVVNGFDNGKLVAVLLSDGRPIWENVVSRPRGRTDIERIVDIDGAPLIIANNVFVSATNGNTVSIALESGQTNWERDIGSHLSIGGEADLLFVPGEKGRVTALDSSTGGVVWEIAKLSDELLSGAAFHAGAVAVPSADGKIYWLSARDGAVLQRESAGGEVRAAPVQVDGRLYVLSVNGKLTTWGRGSSF